MTEKLYDANSYLASFEAKVRSCENTKRGYKILLDKTAFFPEEGGQCCDRGKLGGADVTYVEICGDEIYHYCSCPFEAGDTVSGEIDFSLRYRNMQNHTGEHILCGLAHKLFECENVGFHLGADYVTMDLDKPLTRENLDEIELLANEAVYKNVPVRGFYPDKATLDTTDYRSKSEIEGRVRLVEIEGYDMCACCAPHVAKTGEVGIIKILDHINYKGGVRLNILCGSDALRDYNERYLRNLRISNLLSVKQEDVCAGVERLLEEIGSLRQQLAEKSRIIAGMYADGAEVSDGNICIFARELTRDEMRLTVNELKEKTPGVAAVFCGCDEDGYSYIIGSDTVDLKAVAPEFNKALNGRGGGNSRMIQGSVSAKKDDIQKCMKGI